MSQVKINTWTPAQVGSYRDNKGKYAGTIEIGAGDKVEAHEIQFLESPTVKCGIIEGWQVGVKSDKPKFRVTRNQVEKKAEENDIFMVEVKRLIDWLFEGVT